MEVAFVVGLRKPLVFAFFLFLLVLFGFSAQAAFVKKPILLGGEIEGGTGGAVYCTLSLSAVPLFESNLVKVNAWHSADNALSKVEIFRAVSGTPTFTKIKTLTAAEINHPEYQDIAIEHLDSSLQYNTRYTYKAIFYGTKQTCEAIRYAENIKAAFANDSLCESTESFLNSANDCSSCGDGFCSAKENYSSCPADCTQLNDSICGFDEIASNSNDCLYCGDGACSVGENATNCAIDCVVEQIQSGSEYFYGRELIGLKANGSNYYYHLDNAENVRVISNSSSDQKAWETAYYPFGKKLLDANHTSYFSNVFTPFSFSLKEKDNGGMYYFNARYYSADSGRFASSDPIASASSSNFSYGKANPFKYSDSSGMSIHPKMGEYENYTPLKEAFSYLMFDPIIMQLNESTEKEVIIVPLSEQDVQRIKTERGYAEEAIVWGSLGKDESDPDRMQMGLYMKGIKEMQVDGRKATKYEIIAKIIHAGSHEGQHSTEYALPSMQGPEDQFTFYTKEVMAEMHAINFMENLLKMNIISSELKKAIEAELEQTHMNLERYQKYQEEALKEAMLLWEQQQIMGPEMVGDFQTGAGLPSGEYCADCRYA